MDITQSIGNVNELQCLSRFIELGFECSIPYGNGAKYDFIADINGKLLRIQCKSAIHPKSKMMGQSRDLNAFTFHTCAQTTNTQKTVRHTYSKDQIDYFATYFNGKVYLIPVEECSTSKTLRFAPPASGNKNYNKAEDYEIEKVLFENIQDIFLMKNENEEENNSTEFICSQCNINTVSCEGGICVDCTRINSRKVERPTREILKADIRNNSFLSIGRKYGVSDNAIRKWCKYYNLPFRVSEIKKYTNEEWLTI